LGFGLEAFGERGGVNDAALVETSCYKILLIMGFQLECNGRAFRKNHAGDAGNVLGQRGGGQVLQLNTESNAGFAIFQEGVQYLDGGVFEEPDQRGGAQDRRHVFAGKSDGVRWFDGELQFTSGPDFGWILHNDGRIKAWGLSQGKRGVAQKGNIHGVLAAGEGTVKKSGFQACRKVDKLRASRETDASFSRVIE
jgi:hypothetical protein